MKSVTIKDVAKHAGVGVGTVSRVINKENGVRASTRQKVLTSIEELSFIPNEAARRLPGGKTMTLGVVVPYFTNPSVVRRLQGVVSVISKSDYNLILYDIETEEQSESFVQRMLSRSLLDGVLMISFTPDDKDLVALAQANIPVVLVDASHPACSGVIVDNVVGGYMATQHLLELGHRRIGYISDYLTDQFNSSVIDRYRGYRQALVNAGIQFREDYHWQGCHSRVEATLLAKKLLALPDPPTAIFAYSDTQAIGVIEAAEALGLRIPHDLSVIGFDNIEASEFLHLTTVRQTLYESGVLGSRMLLEKIAEPTKFNIPRQSMLPVELVVRNSTTSPRV